MFNLHKIIKIIVLSLLLQTKFVYAQDGFFLEGYHTPGFNGQINDISKVNDRIIIGGDFNSLNGDTLFNHIASWDGFVFAPIGEGIDGDVFTIADYFGEIVVGGNFFINNGEIVSNIVRWDGESWVPLGKGLNGWVFDLAVYDSNLVAVGKFNGTGDYSRDLSNGIAMWDGQEWQSVGDGFEGSFFGDFPTVLEVYDSNLIAAGSFMGVGGIETKNIARWNGEIWASMGDGFDNSITTMAVHLDTLIVAGPFNRSGENLGENSIHYWDGVNWIPMTTGLESYSGDITIESLDTDNGNLYIGGAFPRRSGIVEHRVAKWSNQSWEFIEEINFIGDFVKINSVHINDGELLVGGLFRMPSKNTYNLLVFNGSIKTLNSTTGKGFYWPQYSIIEHNNDILIGGGAAHPVIDDGYTKWINNGINRWDGFNWVPLSDGIYSVVNEMLSFDEILTIGGRFNGLDNSRYNHIAQWYQNQWIGLESGLNGHVNALTVYNTNIIAAGSFSLTGNWDFNLELKNIARWDGVSWNAIGNGLEGTIHDLIVYNGNLVAAGKITDSGNKEINNIALWDNENEEWFIIGDGLDGEVYSLIIYNNQLIAGGTFRNSGSKSVHYVAMWDGQEWNQVGNNQLGNVFALTEYQGNIIAGGDFSSTKIAEFDGTDWVLFEEEMDGWPLEFLVRDNKLHMVGLFTKTGNVQSSHYAVWDKSGTISSGQNTKDDLPTTISLLQNYPNPFNPNTQINFSIPVATQIRLVVTNMLGQQVATLVNNQTMQAGWHSVQFDASNLASGLYIYRIQAGSFVQTKKMMLIK